MTQARLSPVVIVLLATLSAAAPGSAQDGFIPEPGSRVRVTAPAVARNPIVGTLLEAGERGIVLAGSSSDGTPIPAASITRLERSVRPGRRTAGALAGLIVGLAAVGLKTLHAGGCNDGCSGGNVAAAVVVALPVAALGAIAAPGERWATVPLGGGPGPATASPRSGPRVRLVPQVGRQTGLTLVASF